jgi:uncharacterized protein YhfF
MDVGNRKAIERMWSEYIAATGAVGSYAAWAFGDESDPEMQDELGRLVLDGPKRATAGALAEYEEEGDPLPQVGDHSVILDSAGEPLCIIRATWVDVRPLGEVDEQFAWDEGEGDRTLEWWKAAHVRFWERLGHRVHDDLPVVLERFEKVWPA